MLFLASTLLIWVPMVLVLTIASMVTNALVADRFGWIDIGLPNYVREVQPSEARLVSRKACCGGSRDGSGVTQLFYGTEMPFDVVAAHYMGEMAKRGYVSRTDSEPSWISGAQAIWFNKQGDDACFVITPFTRDFDLARRGFFGADADRLRSKLQAYAHPYVALYEGFCGG